MFNSLCTRIFLCGTNRVFARFSEKKNGPTFVLVHGLILSSTYMQPLAEQLAELSSVYALDLPGFGNSEKPMKVLSISDLGDTVISFLDCLGVERAILVGNSLGCQVIAEAALKHPSRVEKLILIGPTVDPFQRSVRHYLKNYMLDILLEPLSLYPIALKDLFKAGFSRSLKTAQFAMTDAIEKKLPRIHTPTLILRGDKDRFVSQNWAKEARALLPNSQLEIIPNKGHALNFNAPEETAHRIKKFCCQSA